MLEEKVNSLNFKNRLDPGTIVGALITTGFGAFGGYCLGASVNEMYEPLQYAGNVLNYMVTFTSVVMCGVPAGIVGAITGNVIYSQIKNLKKSYSEKK